MRSEIRATRPRNGHSDRRSFRGVRAEDRQGTGWNHQGMGGHAHSVRIDQLAKVARDLPQRRQALCCHGQGCRRCEAIRDHRRIRGENPQFSPETDRASEQKRKDGGGSGGSGPWSGKRRRDAPLFCGSPADVRAPPRGCCDNDFCQSARRADGDR